MSTVEQNGSRILPEYTVDHLGASFKVVLVESAKCVFDEKSQQEEIAIPDFCGLMRAAAIARSVHPMKLSGSDIRFLRKNLGLRAKTLAEHLDISAEHLSRCENGDKVLSPNSEKLLRLLILIEPFQVLQKAIENSEDTLPKVIPDLIACGKAINKLISEMRIISVSDGEELVFKFRYRTSRADDVDRSDNDDESEGKWLNNPLPIAA